MTKGLPASGKSTWCKEWMAKGGNWKRINKDLLREMLDCGKWSRANEKFILDTRDALIWEAFKAGFNVMVDDTNLAEKHKINLKKIADEFGAEFEVKDFTDVSPEVCIERDLKRSNSVGSKVIMQMYNQFLAPKPVVYSPDQTLPQAFCFDIDGTLALMGDRSPYNWSKVGLDSLNYPVFSVQRRLFEAYTIILISGRDSVCRKETEKWLEDNNVDYHFLYMRPEGNTEKDSIVKKRIFDENIKDVYNVVGIFDDRQQVVDAWRSMGLTVFQVAPGDF